MSGEGGPFGWDLPPGARAFDGPVIVEVACRNPACEWQGMPHELPGERDLGTVYLKDEDQAVCDACRWEMTTGATRFEIIEAPEGDLMLVDNRHHDVIAMAVTSSEKANMPHLQREATQEALREDGQR